MIDDNNGPNVIFEGGKMEEVKLNQDHIKNTYE